jgi:hypothetical protein
MLNHITSRAWICTCELASFKFRAMTMLAIFRLSNGLNGFGDFGVLLLPDCGVLIVDEKRWNH